MPHRVITETDKLFAKLRHGDPILSAGEVLGKLVRTGDDEVHMRLIREFRETLELGEGAGWRMLAHHGSEATQMRLISQFPDRLDIKGPYPNAGWLLLSIYGKGQVKARLMDEFPLKLDQGEKIGEEIIITGVGWENIARTGTEAEHMRIITEYPAKADRNGGRVWHHIAMHGTDAVKKEVELRRGIVRP